MTVRRAAWSADAVNQLRAAEHFDTSGGLETVDIYAALNLPLFECVTDAGEVVARYCVNVERARDGATAGLHIVAAAGEAAGVDLTRAIIEAAQAQARALGVDWLSAITRRPGLIRKMQRDGFNQHGVVMRKYIGELQ